jgi:uncharacterized membrane protein
LVKILHGSFCSTMTREVHSLESSQNAQNFNNSSNNSKMNPFFLSVAAGVVAGMRAFSAPAWVASTKHPRSEPLIDGLAFLELIGDKLPSTPNRVAPIQLIARASSGAICAVLATSDIGEKKDRGFFALLGTASAVASTYAMYHLRKMIGKRLNIQDAFVGAAEDALVMGIGASVFKKKKK